MRNLVAILFVVCGSFTHAQPTTNPVYVHEVTDYVFGGYTGDFTSPPSADGNPKRAVIVSWKDQNYRLVFSHEASYCPWLEFPSGAAVCFQFFEGNDGWAELFNQFGRQEKNSFVEIVSSAADGIHIRWTYFGVNQQTGDRAYRAVEDFYALANGLVLRRQTYSSLLPKDPHGYAREPIELIGMCPVGKIWFDVLRVGANTDERHALAVLDPFSDKRYDVYWTRKKDTVWDSTPRREGCAWKDVDDSTGVAMVLPMREGATFCIFGDASGFGHDFTRIKDHSFKDTGGIGWVSSCWDHWPIGWLNSQGHVVDAGTLKKYPNHFAPAGMDFFALDNEKSAARVYWSLIGVGGEDAAPIRTLAKEWLILGSEKLSDPHSVAVLKPVSR